MTWHSWLSLGVEVGVIGAVLILLAGVVGGYLYEKARLAWRRWRCQREIARLAAEMEHVRAARSLPLRYCDKWSAVQQPEDLARAREIAALRTLSTRSDD